jgi:hypothetical protein
MTSGVNASMVKRTTNPLVEEQPAATSGAKSMKSRWGGES